MLLPKNAPPRYYGMQVAAPYCLLCGCCCEDPQQCRVTDAGEIHKILRQKCSPTAFHYRAAMALPPKARYPLCLPCVNWARRSKRVQSSLRAKYFTPLDSVLMHCVAPGRFPEPDQRCYGRLVAAAADPRNGYAAAFPERLRLLLEEASRCAGGATAQGLLGVWWRAHGETTFFRHRETARAVRHTLVFRDSAQQGSRRRWRR